MAFPYFFHAVAYFNNPQCLLAGETRSVVSFAGLTLLEASQRDDYQNAYRQRIEQSPTLPGSLKVTMGGMSFRTNSLAIAS